MRGPVTARLPPLARKTCTLREGDGHARNTRRRQRVLVDHLLDEIARVRKRGFATAFGEHEPTVNAVAMPVFDHRGSVVAALEVRASGNRIPPSRVAALTARIGDAAAVISEYIGGTVASN